jgi:hypothetical protein
LPDLRLESGRIGNYVEHDRRVVKDAAGEYKNVKDRVMVPDALPGKEHDTERIG